MTSDGQASCSSSTVRPGYCHDSQGKSSTVECFERIMRPRNVICNTCFEPTRDMHRTPSAGMLAHETRSRRDSAKVLELQGAGAASLKPMQALEICINLQNTNAIFSAWTSSTNTKLGFELVQSVSSFGTRGPQLKVYGKCMRLNRRLNMISCLLEILIGSLQACRCGISSTWRSCLKEAARLLTIPVSGPRLPGCFPDTSH